MNLYNYYGDLTKYSNPLLPESMELDLLTRFIISMSNRNPNDLDFYPVDERLILGDTRKNPFSTKPNSANDDLYLFWYKDRC